MAGLTLSLPRAAHAIFDGYYNPETEQFDSLRVTNDTIGAVGLYLEGFFGQRTLVANVEAGHPWGGHEAFDRTGLPAFPPTPALAIHGTAIDGDAPALGELASHATMVSGAMAGTGYDAEENSFAYLQMGIAPLATLWSGAIATAFGENGSFSTTEGSFLMPYKAFFNGTFGAKPDVINSSWGYPDAAGIDFFTRTVDGLARQNATVTLVVSAGNDGEGSTNGLGSGFNAITVGGISGERLPDGTFAHWESASNGPAYFYNPETGEAVANARATIHLAAPAKDLLLPAYLGHTGDNGDWPDPEPDPLPTDQYFLNVAGTSFSAPITAGAVSLLKDISYSNTVPGLNTEIARDTRVIRSVLMAGAEATSGWDNGQEWVDGILSTLQSLDYRTGAGALNVAASAAVYREGTTDLAGFGGGLIAAQGWDYGTVSSATAGNDYFFTNPFAEETELTISLNWFVNRAFDNALNLASDESFVNLDLEVWSVAEGTLLELVATSHSTYNNSEFLRFMLEAPGEYAIRVTFAGVVYNLLEEPITSENYALAWRAEVVPEPGTLALFGLPMALLAGRWFIRRRRAHG